MKIVFDSNVILAGFCFDGVCRAVIEVCVDAHEIILSEHVVKEVEHNLRHKMGHTPNETRERIAWLRSVAAMVEPFHVPDDACRDPDDLPVLGTFLASGAQYLVSGDKDLLSLDTFHHLPILSPRQFWERLRKFSGDSPSES